MKHDIDAIAREAFAKMVAEAGEPCRADFRAQPRPDPGQAPIHPARKRRNPLALALTAAAFCAVAVIPPVAARNRPRLAEVAARLPENPQLERYAELLTDSRPLMRNR